MYLQLIVVQISLKIFQTIFNQSHFYEQTTQRAGMQVWEIRFCVYGERCQTCQISTNSNHWHASFRSFGYRNCYRVLDVSRLPSSKLWWNIEGETSSAKHRSGQNPSLRDWRVLKWFMASKKKTSTAKVTAEINWHLAGSYIDNYIRQLHTNQMYSKIVIPNLPVTDGNEKHQLHLCHKWKSWLYDACHKRH